MTILTKAGLIPIAIMAMAAPALAQTAAPAGAAPAAPSAAAPVSSGSFSDDEVQKFASAAIELNKIQADTSVAEAQKQPKMLAAVQASGLEPAKFNAIGQAAQSDPALQQKIQAAAAKTAPAPAAAQAPSATPAPAQ